MSDEATETLRRIGHGIDAEAFLGSDLGKYLLERAEAEIDEAKAGLVEADAENPKLIRELQNKAWRAESFENWIAELIQDGHTAQQELKGEGD